MAATPTRRISSTPTDVTVGFSYQLDPPTPIRPGAPSGRPDPAAVWVSLITADGREFRKRVIVKGRSGSGQVTFGVANLNDRETVRTVVKIEDGNSAQAQGQVPPELRKAALAHFELTAERQDGPAAADGVPYSFTGFLHAERGHKPARGECTLEAPGAQSVAFGVQAQTSAEADAVEVDQFSLPLGVVRVKPGSLVRAQARLAGAPGVLHDGFQVPAEPATIEFFKLIGRAETAPGNAKPTYRIEAQVQVRGWQAGTVSGTVDIGSDSRDFSITINTPGDTGEGGAVFEGVELFAGESVSGTCRLGSGATKNDAWDPGIGASTGSFSMAATPVGHKTYDVTASISARLTARGAEQIQVQIDGGGSGWTRTVEEATYNETAIAVGNYPALASEQTLHGSLLIGGRVVARATVVIPALPPEPKDPPAPDEPEAPAEPTAPEAPTGPPETQRATDPIPIPIPRAPTPDESAEQDRRDQEERDRERERREEEERAREALQVELVRPADGVVTPGLNRIVLRVTDGPNLPRAGLAIQVAITDTSGGAAADELGRLVTTSDVTDAEGLARLDYESNVVPYKPEPQPVITLTVTTHDVPEVNPVDFR